MNFQLLLYFRRQRRWFFSVAVDVAQVIWFDKITRTSLASRVVRVSHIIAQAEAQHRSNRSTAGAPAAKFDSNSELRKGVRGLALARTHSHTTQPLEVGSVDTPIRTRSPAAAERSTPSCEARSPVPTHEASNRRVSGTVSPGDAVKRPCSKQLSLDGSTVGFVKASKVPRLLSLSGLRRIVMKIG